MGLKTYDQPGDAAVHIKRKEIDWTLEGLIARDLVA